MPSIIAFFQPAALDEIAVLDFNATSAPEPKGVLTPEFVPLPPPAHNENVPPVITKDSIPEPTVPEKPQEKPTESSKDATNKDTTQKSPGTGTLNGDPNGLSTTIDRRPSLRTAEYTSIQDYIKKNTKFPEFEKVLGHQGQVIVGVLVNPDGSLSEIHLSKGVSPAFNQEALRIINAMPRLDPGIHNGKPTKVYLRIPIDFQLPGTAQK